ncbi:MAG: S-layer homology domain-containing protein, partial [Oscillospiraceae bacterium]|nr:S-layer homology domain-containing protein [Oscillospiraceae bacterium]
MSQWRKWRQKLGQRTLSLLLALVMTAALAVPAAAATSSLQPYLEKVVSWGVMRGDINGNLNEGNNITRAEFVTMINRAFGYSKTGTTPFQDVPFSAWYAEDVGIAYTEGYINGTTKTTFSPYS